MAFLRRLVPILVLAAMGCGPTIEGMVYGARAPSRPSHFLVVLHNEDTTDEPVSLCFWQASTIVSSMTLTVPSGQARTFDLGPAHPDGLQLVATAWNGILGGPGGLVFQTPDYEQGWVFDVTYPSGTGQVRTR